MPPAISPLAWKALASAAVFAVTIATFADALNNDFVNYDDWGYVFDKRTIEGFTLVNIRRAFTEIILGNYHPLAWLSHMLDVELFGFDARAHHAVNVLIHGVNAVVVLLLLQRFGASLLMAALLTVFWAVHPLRVESVAWVSERKDLLCGFFYFMAMYLWSTRAHGAVIVMATVLAMLSKPMAVTLPVQFLLYDVLCARLPWRDALPRTAPYGLLAAALTGVTLYAQAGGMQTTSLIPPLMRLQTAAVSTAQYLADTVVSSCLHAPYHYPDEWPAPVLFASVIASAALGAMVLWRGKLAVFGGAWFLVALLPVLGFVMVGIAPRADRYTYIPSVGLLLVMRVLLLPLERRRPFVAGAVILAGSLIAATQAQIATWRTTETLVAHALDCDEENAGAHYTFAELAVRRGKLELARVHAERATELRANVPSHPVLAGAVALLEERYENAKDFFVEALSWDSSRSDAHLGLSAALASLGEPYETELMLSATCDEYSPILLHAAAKVYVGLNLGIAHGRVLEAQKCGDELRLNVAPSSVR